MGDLIANFSGRTLHALNARLLYAAIDGCVFAVSRPGAAILLAAETAVMIQSIGARRMLSVGFKSVLACGIARSIWTFFHASQNEIQAKKDAQKGGEGASIWDWEPPAGTAGGAAAWHVLRELARTANALQETYPEIAELLSRPQLKPAELATRLYYLCNEHERQGLAGNSSVEDCEPAPEESLSLLRNYRELCCLVYEKNNDVDLAEALRGRGYRLIAAQYNPEIVVSGCPAYYLAVKSNNNGSKRDSDDRSDVTEADIDEKKKNATSEVVLCIRGTFSAEDVFTDLLASGVIFGASSDSEDDDVSSEKPSSYAHGGMTRASQFLAEKFGLLLFTLVSGGARVTLLGHSLGGGVAALLALILQRMGMDASCLRCLAYEPPACMDLPLAEACAESGVVLSMVHADDVVPRLAAEPYAALLRELLEFDWQKAAGAEGGEGAPLAAQVVRNLAALFIREEIKSQEQHEKSEVGSNPPKTQYNPFVPGKIVYVSASEAAHVRVLLPPKHPILRHIRVSSCMVSDHFIDKDRAMSALGS